MLGTGFPEPHQPMLGRVPGLQSLNQGGFVCIKYICITSVLSTWFWAFHFNLSFIV